MADRKSTCTLKNPELLPKIGEIKKYEFMDRMVEVIVTGHRPSEDCGDVLFKFVDESYAPAHHVFFAHPSELS